MRNIITKEWKDVIGTANADIAFDDTTGNLLVLDKDGEIVESLYDDGDYESLKAKVIQAIKEMEA